MHVRESRTGHIETYRVGAGGEEEGPGIGVPPAIRPLYMSASYVDRGHARAEVQVNFVLFIEFRRPEEIRLLGRGAGKIALREVGPVARQRLVGTQHCDAVGITLAAKRFRSGVSGRTAADNNNRSWRVG